MPRTRSFMAVTLLAIAMLASLSGCGGPEATITSPAVLQSITLSAATLYLPEDGGDVLIDAALVLADGGAGAGIPVEFETTAGQWLPADTVVTDANGLVTVTLRTTVTATIKARALGIESDEIRVEVGAPAMISITVVDEKIEARREASFTIDVVDQFGGATSGGLEVQFGDGRVNSFNITGTVTFTHTYRFAGRYRLVAVFTDDNAVVTQAALRFRVIEPIKLSLEVAGEEEAVIDEATTVTFSASRSDRQPVNGSIDIDYGDGQSERIESFTDEVARSHTYGALETYRIKATITTDDARTATASHKIKIVEETDTSDELDLSTAVFLHADVSDWAQTSTISSVTISTANICIHHSKQNGWPIYNAGTEEVEGNPWVCAKKGGVWYCGTYEWLRPGQSCKGITKSNIGAHIKKEPLTGWRPKLGETVYFFVSAIARTPDRTVLERSNVVKVTWPY